MFLRSPSNFELNMEAWDGMGWKVNLKMMIDKPLFDAENCVCVCIKRDRDR